MHLKTRNRNGRESWEKKMFNDVGIVIPYYHINLTKLEQIAFLQCKKNFRKLSDYNTYSRLFRG